MVDCELYGGVRGRVVMWLTVNCMANWWSRVLWLTVNCIVG